jgi:hypothetical protein
VDDLLSSPAALRLALTATAKLAEWARCCSDAGSSGSGGGGAAGGGGGDGPLQPALWAQALAGGWGSGGGDALRDVAAAAASLRRRMLSFP